MKIKYWGVLSLGVLFGALMSLQAHEMGAEGKDKGTDLTAKGEIVDMACYMGHGAKGKEHKDCADMCIKGGSPMGLLTDQGKVYLLVEDHAKRDAYDSLKNMAGDQVSVTGDLHQRGGIDAITVEKAQKAG